MRPHTLYRGDNRPQLTGDTLTKTTFFPPRRLVVAVLALSPLSSTACSDGPAPAPAASTTATSATAAATSSAVPSATAPDPSASPAPAKPSSFVSVAKVSGYSTLYPVKDAFIIASRDLGTSAAAPDKPTRIGFVKGDKVDFSGGHELSALRYVVAVRGAWPDKVLVLSNTRNDAAATDKLGPLGFGAGSAIQQSHWVGAGQIGLNLVAMRTSSEPDRAARIDTLQSQGPPLDYELARHEGVQCTTQATVVYPLAFTATTTGAALSVGKKCDGSAAAELWPAPNKPSTITNLPITLKPYKTIRLVPGVKGDAWLFADDLFYFDGTTWAKQALPPATLFLHDGSVAGDGTLWAHGRAVQSSSQLFALQNGAWRDEPLPDGEGPSDLAITNDGTVWVTTRTSLLRTRRPTD